MNESDVIDMIKGRMELRNIRNTKFIEIKAYSDNAQEACDLANQIAKSYHEYRAEEYDDLKNHGITSLQKQLAEQDAKIATLQSNVDQLRVKI